MWTTYANEILVLPFLALAWFTLDVLSSNLSLVATPLEVVSGSRRSLSHILSVAKSHFLRTMENTSLAAKTLGLRYICIDITFRMPMLGQRQGKIGLVDHI